MSILSLAATRQMPLQRNNQRFPSKPLINPVIPVIASEAWQSRKAESVGWRLFATLTPSGPPCGRSAPRTDELSIVSLTRHFLIETRAVHLLAFGLNSGCLLDQETQNQPISRQPAENHHYHYVRIRGQPSCTEDKNTQMLNIDQYSHSNDLVDWWRELTAYDCGRWG